MLHIYYYYHDTYVIILFSINTQVIIQNRTLTLARYLGLSADKSPRRTKMAASSRFATVSGNDFA